jgi:hypothetical protein
MFVAALLGESWTDLAARLDAGDTLARWAAGEPALSGLDSFDQLHAALQPGSDPARWDELFGSLLRLAAADGGDEQDAVLVVLHLVDAAAGRLRRRFEADLILGQLAIQIRSFPWRTRTRAYAANLLLDTEHALCREARPNWMRTRGQEQRAGEDLPVDPTDRDQVSGLGGLDTAVSGPDSDDLDLVDLLLWAERTGVVDARDLSMLVEYFYARELTGGSGHEHVAQVYGVNLRTSKRRCTAALEALRAAAPNYLAA